MVLEVVAVMVLMMVIVMVVVVMVMIMLEIQSRGSVDGGGSDRGEDDGGGDSCDDRRGDGVGGYSEVNELEGFGNEGQGRAAGVVMSCCPVDVIP